MPPLRSCGALVPAAAQQLFSDWMEVHQTQAKVIFFTPIVFMVITFIQRRDDCPHFAEAKMEEEKKKKERK